MRCNVARRRPPERPDGAADQPLLPSELAIYRKDEWASFRDYNHAKAAWFRAHGINAGNWSAVYPVLLASKRKHARSRNERPSVDRMRLVVGEDQHPGHSVDG